MAGRGGARASPRISGPSSAGECSRSTRIFPASESTTDGAAHWPSPGTGFPCSAGSDPGVFSAGGYSGHGVALANWAGMAIAEAVRGTADRFDLMSSLPVSKLPGGVRFGDALPVLALAWYAIRDRV